MFPVIFPFSFRFVLCKIFPSPQKPAKQQGEEAKQQPPPLPQLCTRSTDIQTFNCNEILSKKLDIVKPDDRGRQGGGSKVTRAGKGDGQ